VDPRVDAGCRPARRPARRRAFPSGGERTCELAHTRIRLQRARLAVDLEAIEMATTIVDHVDDEPRAVEGELRPVMRALDRTAVCAGSAALDS